MTYVYPQQDLDQPIKLQTLLGSYWSGPYGGSGIVRHFAATRSQLEMQTVQNVLESEQSTSRFKVPVYHTDLWYQLVLKESEMNVYRFAVPHYGEGFVYGVQPETSVTLAYGRSVERELYAFALPTGLEGAPAIYNRLDLPTLSWIQGIDYVFQNGYLRLRENPFESEDLVPRDVYENGEIVDREVAVWMFRAQRDQKHVWNHFGHILNVYLESSERYRDMVNAIWDALVESSSLESVSDLLSAIADSPLVKEDDETVQYILRDSKHLLVITDQHAYKHNRDATATVAVGDTVHKGQFLTEAVRTYSPGHESPADWLYAYGVDEHLTHRKYKGGLLFVDEEVETIVDERDGFTELKFNVRGWGDTVDQFWDDVHAEGVSRGQTLAHLLDNRPEEMRVAEPPVNALPATINPLQFLVENLLRSNALFVVLKPNEFGANALPFWTLGLLRRIVPPQQAVLLTVRLHAEEEPYELTNEELTHYSPLTIEDDTYTLVDYGDEELLAAGYVDPVCL